MDSTLFNRFVSFQYRCQYFLDDAHRFVRSQQLAAKYFYPFMGFYDWFRQEAGIEGNAQCMQNTCMQRYRNDVLPGLIEIMKNEFADSRKKFDYIPPVGPEVKPGLPSHMREK